MMRSLAARWFVLLLAGAMFANAAEPDAKVLEHGRVQFMMCAACHGQGGEGTAAAPPLAGSEWVAGPVENLIRIQLRGLRGPITVKGRVYDIPAGMAPMAYQSDDQIAAVLTYVRKSFGNNAPAVEPGQVAALRSEVGKPQLTAADLIPHGVTSPSVTATAAQANKYANLDEGEKLPRWGVIGMVLAIIAGVGLWLVKSK